MTLVALATPPLWKSWQNHDNNVVRWVSVSDLHRKLGLYESVFWEPLDTESFRMLLKEQPEFIKSKRVLEIGTGSGLLAICCMKSDAASVVATDINPNAVACARANARRHETLIDVRLVPSSPQWEQADEAVDSTRPDSSAFSVIHADEKFDLIVSNPPWEDSTPNQWSDFALYDEQFELLRSILTGARSHLNPGGKIVLIYGCVEAIEVTRRLADEHDYNFVILDQRDPDSLPTVFLPGMMVGLVPNETLNQ